MLINQSGIPSLERFHGRAVRLFADSTRLPFHGAFLIHEMRVRGFCPFADDRRISLPIPWQSWIQPDHGHDEVKSKDDDFQSATRAIPVSASPHAESSKPQPRSGYNSAVETLYANSKMLTLTNPFANPAELQALKRSFAEQPNWKAAVVEGESWEGNAEENMEKYRRMTGI